MKAYIQHHERKFEAIEPAPNDDSLWYAVLFAVAPVVFVYAVLFAVAPVVFVFAVLALRAVL